MIADSLQSKTNIVLLCIGTDKCIGDFLGPFIGTFLIGKDYLAEQINKNNLNAGNFRNYVHSPNGIKGISENEAKKIMNQVWPLCTISSSDPQSVYEYAIKRRL